MKNWILSFSTIFVAMLLFYSLANGQIRTEIGNDLKLEKIIYLIKNKDLLNQVLAKKSASYLKIGQYYNTETMIAERKRIQEIIGTGGQDANHSDVKFLIDSTYHKGFYTLSIVVTK